MNRVFRWLQHHLYQRQSHPGYQNLWQRLHLDSQLLIGLLTLSAIGLVILYSASHHDMSVVIRQCIRLGMAYGILLVLAQVPPTYYQRLSPWLYGLGVMLLAIVIAKGVISKGAQRWLDLGFLRFQPSELLKIALPMACATFFSQRQLPPRLGDLAIAALIILFPVILTAKQPDLGTALVIAGSGLFVILLAGLPWRYIISLSVGAVACVPILWHFFMHDYQRQRVLTFLNPERDPLGSGYHIIQSKIAIGSGGIFGKGLLQGTQSQLNFLPEHTTDFIFAVMGEEFGFIGCLALIAVYLFITLRGLRIANQAQNTFSRLLIGSLSLMFFTSAFINIGMVSGLLPVVGLPLPLVSYGGTSMITLMVAFGIVMSIHSHRQLVGQ